MPTQLIIARDGLLTDQMRFAADAEGVDPTVVCAEIAAGRAVLPFNPAHNAARPCVIGRRFSTKINANIGRSVRCSSGEEEIEKLKAARAVGADVVMDLSVGPDVSVVRHRLLSMCDVPLGTVPIYEAFHNVGETIERLDYEALREAIERQAVEGVDFMTLHAGLLKAHVPLAMKRKLGIASRGGAILAEWMARFERENPLFENWDDVMDLCARHDVTVSLGDGLRPGCLADAGDAAQFAELDVLGDLVRRCIERGVQVMVEGPGHVPFDQIQMNMEREQKVCHGAPFYVLGPLVTDIAPGYDHITAAIGATAAAFYGAALLCYVTPAEHLALPTAEEVRQGVVAFKIAAHAADVARCLKGARDRDDAMSEARGALDWRRQFALALDGETAKRRYEMGRAAGEAEDDHCSMCGRTFCAMRTTGRIRARLEGTGNCS